MGLFVKRNVYVIFNLISVCMTKERTFFLKSRQLLCDRLEFLLDLLHINTYIYIYIYICIYMIYTNL